MIKCFLSHSSKDKERYVRIVADNLRSDATILDERTFEKGMMTIEEIQKALNETSLFIIFLSRHALESEWVQNELANARELLEQKQLDRIYPIIIDSELTYNDLRIPKWMKDELNIQPIHSPKVAARKINVRLTELAWKFHPRLKERQGIFVGRNELIQQIEERLDDFNQLYPIALIASGLPSIGRKSILQYAMIKANLVKSAYKFISLTLAHQDSIEDFLLKIVDTGVYAISQSQKYIIFSGSLEEKVLFAKEVFSAVAAEQERIIIEDHGVIIQRDGEIVDWFKDILISLETTGHLMFCITTQIRPNPALNRIFPNIFTFAVKELEEPERKGLLKRYLAFQDIDSLKIDDLKFFSDLLTGYPQQIFFAVDQIKELGIKTAKGNSHLIQQYASDKAKIILDSYKHNPEIIDFILLLAKFEFVSYEVLFKIVDEIKYNIILQELLINSICEHIGKASEYIRVNEVIRDYISRSRFELDNKFNFAIKKYAHEFVKNYTDDNFDISGYLFSAKEALLNGEDIPDQLILPSVFIRAIKKLYDEDRNYKEAIILADRVLLKEGFLHKNTVDYVRFLKCQALARLQNGSNFFTEVHKLSNGSEQEFLTGFYYRLAGKSTQAEEHLNASLERKKYKDPKVIGELIRVYMQNEDYQRAYAYAEENYNNRPGNIINSNDYFTCVLMQDDDRNQRATLDRIIERLSIDPSDKAQEVAISMKARVYAFYDNDIVTSFDMLNEAIYKFPKVAYPLLTKADLAVYYKDLANLKEAVDSLETIVNKHAQTYRSFIRYKACFLAMGNHLQEAIKLIDVELKGLNKISIERLKDKLRLITPRK